MKILILFLIIAAVQPNDIITQQRCYTHDTAGNRTQRACDCPGWQHGGPARRRARGPAARRK